MGRSVPRRGSTRGSLRSVLALAVVALCLGCATDAPGRTGARVLLVTGEDYEGHDWRLTAPVVAAVLAADPRLDVETLDDLSALRADRLRDRDVVVMHFKNYDPEVPGRAGFDALREFVAGGGGLVLLHFAGGAFQEFRPEFAEFAGRTWNPELRGHDPRGPFSVEITDLAHPVTAGMSAFETDDELYTCLEGETPIDVLAHARSQVDAELYPMAFTLRYGEGRVFHTPLGHDVAAFSTPAVAGLIRRGTVWAAGLPAGDPDRVGPRLQ